MTTVASLDVQHRERQPPITLRGTRRRRLSSIIQRHADHTRPFVVSVHPRGELRKPCDATVRLRADWPRTLVERDQDVAITYLPLGGGGGGSAKQIGGALAMIALAIAAPYAVAALGSSALVQAGALTFAGRAVAAGTPVGPALLTGSEK